MSQPAVPLPGRLGRNKVLAAESARMNGQLLAAALAVVLYVFRFRKDKDWMAASPSGTAPVRASGPELLTTPSKPTGKMCHKMAPLIAAGL
jgi:hypothetical protein